MSALREFPRGEPIIFPAVDVRGGRCVRLVRGERDAEIPYEDSPRAAAERFVAAGANCLHVIDLGAALGEAHSAEVLCEIATAVDVPRDSSRGAWRGSSSGRAPSATRTSSLAWSTAGGRGGSWSGSTVTAIG